MEREQLVSLVSKAQAGDQAALNDLFNSFYNDVYYFALKTVKDEDLAMDITQEAFVEIINTLGSLKEPAAFVTWMKQITYHQCTRYFKKKKDVIVDEDEEGHSVFDNIEDESTEFIPGEALDQADFKATILAMLDSLSEEQRSATMMYYFDEMSVKEIADIQGVSEGTVKSRLNYARKALKESVEDYEKKNGIKLHGLGMFPLFRWLLQGAFEGSMPIAAAGSIAEGVAGATGTAISVGSAVSTATAATATAATATAATTATVATTGMSLTAKVVSIVVAASIAVGGGTAAVIIAGNSNEPSEPVSGTQSEVDDEEDITPQGGVVIAENGDISLEGVIPEGCVYYKADGTVLNAGEDFPETSVAGDYLTYGDYVYGYEFLVSYGENGEIEDTAFAADVDFDDMHLTAEDMLGSWYPLVIDRNKESYGAIVAKINGLPILHVSVTFANCLNLKDASVIKLPSTTKYMCATFLGCFGLRNASALVIPDSVINMDAAFSSCSSLVSAPVIPASVQHLCSAFSDCAQLTGDITINCTPSRYDGCFLFTAAPINLVGSCERSVLEKMAETSSLGNVTVFGNKVDGVKLNKLNAKIEQLENAFETCLPCSYTGSFEVDNFKSINKNDALLFAVHYALNNGNADIVEEDIVYTTYLFSKETLQNTSKALYGYEIDLSPMDDIDIKISAHSGSSDFLEVTLSHAVWVEGKEIRHLSTNRSGNTAMVTFRDESESQGAGGNLESAQSGYEIVLNWSDELNDWYMVKYSEFMF